jgi:putative CocE/NonD family hydrolase
VVGPWDHSPLPLGTGAGETDFGAAAAFDLAGAQRAWFDSFLREEAEPDWPPVRAFVTGWNRWEAWPTWPPPQRAEAWYLHSDGSLGPSVSAVAEHRFATDADDPTPTVGGRLCCAPYLLRAGPRDQSERAARSDVRSYASPVLDRDLLVAGPVLAEVWSASTTSPADVHVTLVDVASDGRAMYLADGIAREDGLDDDPAPFRVRLGHLAHAFRPGHRVRVDIAGASFPRFDRVPSTGRAQRTLELGGPAGSRVVLPIAE